MCNLTQKVPFPLPDGQVLKCCHTAIPLSQVDIQLITLCQGQTNPYGQTCSIWSSFDQNGELKIFVRQVVQPD